MAEAASTDNSFNEPMVGFIAGSSLMLIHILGVCSRHFSVAFDIPDINTGIYFSKLYGIRGLMVFFGSLLEYIVDFYKLLNREQFSFFAFCLTFILRFFCLISLHVSEKLPIHFYDILVAEGFFYGIYQMSFFSLIPKYAAIAVLSIDISSVFVFFIQWLLDRIWYEQPLIMVKLQLWICCICTFVSVGLWGYYLFKSKTNEEPKECVVDESSKEENKFACLNFTKYNYRGDLYKSKREKGLLYHFERALSPFMILMVAFLFKDILFPAVLPYSLLDRDRCHTINMLVPVFYALGSVLMYLIHKHFCNFKRWEWYIEFFWLLMIPLVIIFLFSILALHTEFKYSQKIKGSKARVSIMTIVLMVSFSIIEAISYAGVADYVYYRARNDPSSVSVLSLHNLVANVCRFLSSKVSIGYNSFRVEHQNTIKYFYPTYKMDPIQATCFWIGTTIKGAYNDALSDMKLDISQYL